MLRGRTGGPLQLNTSSAATLQESRSEESSPNSTGQTALGRKLSARMTPRGGSGRFGSFIRTSYLEEKKTRSGFRWRLEFEDPEVEQIYKEESWKKTQKGYRVLILLIVLSSVWEWLVLDRETSRLRFIVSLLIIIGASYFEQGLELCKIHNVYGSLLMAVVIMVEAFAKCDTGLLLITKSTCQRLTKDGEIPPIWLLAPILHHFLVYFGPVSFYDGLFGHLVLLGICVLSMANHVRDKEGLGILISFVAANIVLLKEMHALEKHDRDYFLEAHLALKTLHNMPQKEESLAAQEEEMTLVRNAMHLAFPNNPFHDKATETRIEKCRQQLGFNNQDNLVSDGLVPVGTTPVPRHVLHIPGKLRGIRVARYKHHGDPVVVQSIPNLEVLESDDDLLEFIQVVENASGLAEIPGLTKTVGYCLSPCTFVVEDVVSEPVITLSELALELGAKELRLDWYFVKPLMACLSGTLAILHRNGVLHRCVSSSTILLTSKETCVLSPIAFHHALPEARRKLWGNEKIWRVAPEAKDDPQEYTAASEVWASCVVAWEMLVGPFTNQVTPFAIPPTVPKTIANLIIEGLSDDPDGRPTMDELYNAFNQEDPSRDSTVASADVFESILKRLETGEASHFPHSNNNNNNSSADSVRSAGGAPTLVSESNTSSVATVERQQQQQQQRGFPSSDAAGPGGAPGAAPAIKPALHPHNQFTASPTSRANQRVKFAAFDESEPT